MDNFWADLPRPFFILAPMEAVTDVVFRHVVAKAGAPDVWFTEFTNATGWAHAGDKAIGGRLVKTNDENPIVAQLWGAEPAAMKKLASHCVELGYNGIDINMGCPDSSATKGGGGAAMILNPENAAAMIAAAKTSGLPVSVKTRLGYSSIDEWREWLTHILRQNIVNLTIHLRTKKEMSKVPAHYELISEIKKFRDEIAPWTLLTINGDIRDRQHGMELVTQYGIDGIMIGRGIFANPFAFASVQSFASSPSKSPATASRRVSATLAAAETRAADVPGDFDGEEANGISTGEQRKKQLLELLHLQLDLHDEYDAILARKFDPLKRFFKIYVRDFAGASELRDQLMHAKSTDEVRALIADWSL